MVFGHRKCFRVYRVIIGVSEWVLDTLGRLVGLLGHKRGAHQPTRGCHAPPMAVALVRKGKRGDSTSPFLPVPLSFPPPTNMAGGRGQGQEPK